MNDTRLTTLLNINNINASAELILNDLRNSCGENFIPFNDILIQDLNVISDDNIADLFVYFGTHIEHSNKVNNLLLLLNTHPQGIASFLIYALIELTFFPRDALIDSTVINSICKLAYMYPDHAVSLKCWVVLGIFNKFYTFFQHANCHINIEVYEMLLKHIQIMVHIGFHEGFTTYISEVHDTFLPRMTYGLEIPNRFLQILNIDNAVPLPLELADNINPQNQPLPGGDFLRKILLRSLHF